MITSSHELEIKSPLPTPHLSYYNTPNSLGKQTKKRILLYSVFRTRIPPWLNSHLDSECTISRSKNVTSGNLHFLPTSIVPKTSSDGRIQALHLQEETYFNMEKWKPELKALQRWKIYNTFWYLFCYFTHFIYQIMLPSTSHLGKNYVGFPSWL